MPGNVIGHEPRDEHNRRGRTRLVAPCESAIPAGAHGFQYFGPPLPSTNRSGSAISTEGSAFIGELALQFDFQLHGNLNATLAQPEIGILRAVGGSKKASPNGCRIGDGYPPGLRRRCDPANEYVLSGHIEQPGCSPWPTDNVTQQARSAAGGSRNWPGNPATLTPAY